MLFLNFSRHLLRPITVKSLGVRRLLFDLSRKLR